VIETYSIALSGLNASSRRLQVSGNNVANAFSTVQTAPDGSLVNDPYRAQRVAQTSLEGGGVSSSLRGRIQIVPTPANGRPRRGIQRVGLEPRGTGATALTRRE
jgi:hypothetical protein